MFEVDLAGFDLRVIEQFLDQRQQRIARGSDRLGIGRLLRRQRSFEQQAVHADDAVERRADFVRGHREEARLGLVRGVGVIPRFAERAFGFGAVGDVATDALQLREFAGAGADDALAPRDPAGTCGACDLLIVNAGAVRIDIDVALLDDRQRILAAQQGLAGALRQFAECIVDEGDGAIGGTHHDQVALGFEQGARAFLGFLELPVAIDQCFVMRSDDAHLLAKPAHPHALHRQRDAGQGK